MKDAVVSILMDVFPDAKRRDIHRAADLIMEKLKTPRETIVVKGANE